MSNICEHFKVTCGIVVVCETWGEVDLSKCFSPVEGHQNEVNWSKDNNFSPTGNFLVLAWPNGWVSGKRNDRYFHIPLCQNPIDVKYRGTLFEISVDHTLPNLKMKELVKFKFLTIS